MKQYDVAIVGGGIVGLATAYQLLKSHPDLAVLLLEKEAAVAQHQTGHNSGVIHSGIYYRPGSLRAQNCRAGKAQLEAFCTEQGIPFDRCGKVIVATRPAELPGLASILERGQANGVECRRISGEELREREPHCAGLEAIHVPEAGIVDYKQVAQRLADLIVEQGGRIQCRAQLQKVKQESASTVLITPQGEFSARCVVTCAGLHSDRVAQLCGWKSTTRIVPFRGEYYELTPEAQHLCRHLIYPVPDPRFPFLGVHFTRMIGGGVECGPNAVLALAREGYLKTDLNLRDLFDSVSFRGFRSLSWKYWPMGLGEIWRSCSKAAFVKALQRLVPEIQSRHLHTAPAGVRAQAVSAEGNLVDDFVIETCGRMVHVLNAPSPAATASLQIGRTIADRIAPVLGKSSGIAG